MKDDRRWELSVMLAPHVQDKEFVGSLYQQLEQVDDEDEPETTQETVDRSRWQLEQSGILRTAPSRAV